VSEDTLLRRLAKEEVEKRKKQPMPKMVYIHVQLPIQMYRVLQVYCERRGLKMGEVVRRALDMYFDHEREKGRL
jgi:predicted solute-binding protein